MKFFIDFRREWQNAVRRQGRWLTFKTVATSPYRVCMYFTGTGLEFLGAWCIRASGL